ncbi:Glycosyl transferase, group 1 [Chitinispirillum alkaliphilum]|nr:Glycosyl transferase, group 1 [Chitinispirillum alkaliphilum]
MKIGIVSPYFYPWYGGITEHVYHQYMELKKRGHTVKMISPFDGGERVADKSDIIKLGNPVPLIVNGSVVKIPILGRSKKAIDKIITREQFDLLHLHQPLFCLLGISFLQRIIQRQKKGLPVPKIAGTFHACGGATERFLINRIGLFFKKFRNQFDAKIAVSIASRDFVLPVLPGNYDIIANGVDIERFSNHPSTIPEYNDGVCNILFVGRLEPRKGLTSLLQSLSFIKKYTDKKFRLIVVGNGVLTNFYKQKIPPCCVDNVCFVGDVSFNDLPSYYKSAQIFCSPATDRESFGIVLIEAMASGVPIVAANNDGYRKVIKDEVNGLLVDPENPEALAKSLARLIGSERDRTKLSKQGKLDCVEYSWMNIVDKLECIYNNVLSQSLSSNIETKSGKKTNAQKKYVYR